MTPITNLIRAGTICLLFSYISTAFGQMLNSSMLSLIRARMINGTSTNWEAGTQAETILEIDFSELAVFSPAYLSPTPPYTVADLQPVISIAETAVNNRSGSEQLWGADGSAGDPASLGVAVLVANWTNAPYAAYAQAAEQQLGLLLAGTPRVETGLAAGAISHRTDSVALWSDFIYMVPPFLAYYGAVTNNISLIHEAYNQISLYRDALLSTNVSLWEHIYCPGPYDATVNNFNDTGHWGTGNGWVAAGMLRVLATMKNSPWSISDFQTQEEDLSNWITEVHTGMSAVLPPSGIFGNFVDVADDAVVTTFEGAVNFPDASGTALFASTVYRHLTLNNPPNYENITASAEIARNALYGNNGTAHFDMDGWLFPVVDPHAFAQSGNNSDEAQSFVLQLDSNWKTWIASNSVISVGRRRVATTLSFASITALVCAIVILLV
ncbi:hypothetical protein FRB98_008591 [Tulasnella sp. 332]|nr:hypothetical protein FRB98_008591 [Tulasnella sp. 332]